MSAPPSAPPPEGPAGTIGGSPLTIHDHVCVFHRGPEEGRELLLDFLLEAVEAQQAALGLVAAGQLSGYRVALAAADGTLLMLDDPAGGYLSEGVFDPDRMMRFWARWGDQTFRDGGHPFARIGVDMSWAEPFVSPAFITELMAYEIRFHGWARVNPQVAVCLYDLEMFGGELVVPAIRVHPKVWLAGMMIENPYYLDQSR
jgi:hypothetical protein